MLISNLCEVHETSQQDRALNRTAILCKFIKRISRYISTCMVLTASIAVYRPAEVLMENMLRIYVKFHHNRSVVRYIVPSIETRIIFNIISSYLIHHFIILFHLILLFCLILFILDCNQVIICQDLICLKKF